MPRPGGPKVSEKPKNFFLSMIKLIDSLKSWHVIMTIALVIAMVSSILSLIAPNKLSNLTDEIGKGLTLNTKNLKLVVEKISENITEDKIKGLMASDAIGQEEKMNLADSFNNSKTDENKYRVILNLSDDALLSMLDDISIDGKTINKKDQLKTLRIMSEVDAKSSTNKTLKQIDKLPKSVYNLVKPKMNTEKIKQIAIFIGILYIVGSLFSFIQNFSMTTVSNNFARKLRKSISSKINRLPLKYFDNHEIGDVLSRVTNDVDTIAQNLNDSLATIVSSLTMFIGSIIMMFVTNWIMAITAILSSLIGFSLMFSILKRTQKYFEQSQKSLGDVNGYIEEIYSGHNVVSAYNASEGAIKDFDKLNNNLYEAKRKSIFFGGCMQPIMSFVGDFGYVAVCVVGALLVLNNHITFGVIVAFIIYVRLFTNPMKQIAQSMTSLQSTVAASERVFEFLDEKEMKSEKRIKKYLDCSKAKGKIEFKHVKFGYDRSRLIIKDFSAKIKPGQKIAIVGPTGAGKTTIVNLLMKFYDINDGEILIDGIPISELSRDNIHKLFCMVLQDTWLFEGTIRDNIKFNNDKVTDEDVMEACKVVGVDHFIKALPNGLDAKINDSNTISQGQTQLFTIARGMLEDAPFLILDEATSNVDTRTEELVQKAMDKLMEKKTSFIIAHRLSTIKNADLILVMNEGNIIEQGTHDELMKQKGFYEKLYNSQFEKIS